MAANRNRRNQPLRIPLNFDQALDGLLAIDPTKLPKRARPGAKKKAAKKGKSNRNNQAKG